VAPPCVQRKAGRDCRAVPAQGLADLCRGQIRTRKYTDKDGVEKYATDIRVDQMQMLGSRQGQGAPSSEDDGGYGGGYSQGGGGGGGGGGYSRPPAAAPRAPAASPAARQAPAKSSSGFDDMDDDIPF
jgi:single-strand DNA-binding protein